MDQITYRLPLVIGATGHRDLRDKDIPALRSAVREVIDERITCLAGANDYCVESHEELLQTEWRPDNTALDEWESERLQ